MKRYLSQIVPLLLPLSLVVQVVESRGRSSPVDAHHRRAIVGGAIADPGRYPYYVRLDYDGEFGCGGSLIAKDFVLTAAHCAFPSDIGSVEAIVGGHNYTTPGLPRKVINIFPHIAYDDFISVSNDIALLQIEPVPEEASIPMIQFQSSRDFLQVGDSVTVIGLGVTENEIEAEQLKEVELKIVEEAACDDLYEGGIHRKSMLCAADAGEDVCQGDSGGPLIVLGETSAEDVQVGVVSWGEECGISDKPGVYADVAYLQSWIESVMCKHSDTPTPGCEVLVDSQTGPILLNPDEDVCRDFPGAFFTDWWHQFQRCDWLRDGGRINSYCFESNEAWVNCPLTCHGCTYEADDDFFLENADDWTNYDRSSNQAAMVGVLMTSSILLCILLAYLGCCKCCYRFTRRRSQPSDNIDDQGHQGDNTAANKLEEEQAPIMTSAVVVEPSV